MIVTPQNQNVCYITGCNNCPINNAIYCTNHKHTKKRWRYKINGQEYEVIEVLDWQGNRVWSKTMPVGHTSPQIAANILDMPNAVDWNIRESHLQTVHPDGSKANYENVATAGSFVCTTGTSFFLNP